MAIQSIALCDIQDGGAQMRVEMKPDELREQKPDLPKPPTARAANEPDGFVLFDSKRDYLNQMDAYREWQRR